MAKPHGGEGEAKTKAQGAEMAERKGKKTAASPSSQIYKPRASSPGQMPRAQSLQGIFSSR
jgi:hypothetical protein